MIEQKHTSGDWVVFDVDGVQEIHAIIDGTPVMICRMETGIFDSDVGPQYLLSEDEAKSNAGRIFACVKACVGIPTEALEEHGKNSDASLALIDSYARQRDELLAALKDCVEALDHCERSLHMRVNPPTLINARAAIAKVES